jgi:hypothetical protein
MSPQSPIARAIEIGTSIILGYLRMPSGFADGLRWSAASAVEGLSCVVPFYGIPLAEYWDAAKMRVPIQAHFAKNDDWAKAERAEQLARCDPAWRPLGGLCLRRRPRVYAGERSERVRREGSRRRVAARDRVPA